VAKNYTPDRDASLGLIFRLNHLWALTDYAALGGDYDKWNNLLDRIYCNLLYRNKMVVKKDSEGKIESIILEKKDSGEYNYISKQISLLRNTCRKIKPKYSQKKKLFRSRWYHSIQKKDIWLRKLMQELQLYLKETEKTPGSAMFGNFRSGSKK